MILYPGASPAGAEGVRAPPQWGTSSQRLRGFGTLSAAVVPDGSGAAALLAVTSTALLGKGCEVSPAPCPSGGRGGPKVTARLGRGCGGVSPTLPPCGWGRADTA